MRFLSFRQCAIVLATFITIATNLLAEVVPINGKTTAQISDQFNVFFVPAGYVFAIWGIIYVGILAFSIYQATASQEKNKLFDKLFGWYLLSCLANCIWIFLWHYQRIGLSVCAMVIVLLSLTVIYVMIARLPEYKTGLFNWYVKYPFSIYFAWIIVASIANVTVFLDYWGWNGFGLSGALWASLLMLTVGLVTVLVLMQRKDLAFATVIVWALFGIVEKFPGTSIIVLAGLLSIATIIVTAVYRLALIEPNGKKSTKPSKFHSA